MGSTARHLAVLSSLPQHDLAELNVLEFYWFVHESGAGVFLPLSELYQGRFQSWQLCVKLLSLMNSCFHAPIDSKGASCSNLNSVLTP